MDWIKPTFKPQPSEKRPLELKYQHNRKIQKISSIKKVSPTIYSSDEDEFKERNSNSLGQSEVFIIPDTIKRDLLSVNEENTSSCNESLKNVFMEKQQLHNNEEICQNDVIYSSSDASPQKNVRTIQFSPLNSDKKKHRLKLLKNKKKDNFSERKNALLKFSQDAEDEELNENLPDFEITCSQSTTNPLADIEIFDDSVDNCNSVTENLLGESPQPSDLSDPRSPDIMSWYMEEKKQWHPITVSRTNELDIIDVLQESDVEEHPLQKYYRADTMRMGKPKILEAPSDEYYKDVILGCSSPESPKNVDHVCLSYEQNTCDKSSEDELSSRKHKNSRCNSLYKKFFETERRVRNNLLSFSYEIEMGLVEWSTNDISDILVVKRFWKECQCFFILCHAFNPVYKRDDKLCHIFNNLILSTESVIEGLEKECFVVVAFPVLSVAHTGMKTVFVKVGSKSVKIIPNNAAVNKPVVSSDTEILNDVIGKNVLKFHETNEKICIVRRILIKEPTNLLDAFANCLLTNRFSLKLKFLGLVRNVEDDELIVLGIDEENVFCTMHLSSIWTSKIERDIHLYMQKTLTITSTAIKGVESFHNWMHRKESCVESFVKSMKEKNYSNFCFVFNLYVFNGMWEMDNQESIELLL